MSSDHKRMHELVMASLKQLVAELKTWSGRERDVVSWYAFGPLLDHDRDNALIKDRRQIVIEGCVQQVRGQKRRVNKDLIIWAKREDACLQFAHDAPKCPAPMAVFEWKYDGQAKATKVNTPERKAARSWLLKFTNRFRDTSGYFVDIRHPEKGAPVAKVVHFRDGNRETYEITSDP